MTDDTNKIISPHSLVLEDRNKLNVTGVTDVDSFDETAIIAYTGYGELTITGTQLHICKLNIDEGELSVEGNIASMAYSEQTPKSTTFFGKMFR